jgi:hypothetical protein
VLPDDRIHCRRFHVGSDARNDAPAAFNHAKDGSLIVTFASASTHPASAMPILAFAADVGFIHLDRQSLQLHVRFGQQRADLLEHPPRGFIGDASLPLDLLR